MQVLGEEATDEKFFIAFAKFEERMKEHERARALYKYALDHIPKKEAQELYKQWISFEKKTGDREGIEDVIIGKRRFQYEEQLKANSKNYDIWFDYIRLEESYGDIEKVCAKLSFVSLLRPQSYRCVKTRDVYERAIAELPPAQEKRFWRRYIYFWIYYALFEVLFCRHVSSYVWVFSRSLRRKTLIELARCTRSAFAACHIRFSPSASCGFSMRTLRFDKRICRERAWCLAVLWVSRRRRRSSRHTLT